MNNDFVNCITITYYNYLKTILYTYCYAKKKKIKRTNSFFNIINKWIYI